MRRVGRGCSGQARPPPPPPRLSGRLLAALPSVRLCLGSSASHLSAASVRGSLSEHRGRPHLSTFPGRGTHGSLCLAALGSRSPATNQPGRPCSPFSQASPPVEPKQQGPSWACRRPIPSVLHGSPEHTCRPARVSPLLSALHSPPHPLCPFSHQLGLRPLGNAFCLSHLSYSLQIKSFWYLGICDAVGLSAWDREGQRVCVCVCVCVCARTCVQVSPEGHVVEERDCGGETETEEGGKRGRDKEKGRDRERKTDTERQEEWQTVVPPVVEGDAGSVCAFVSVPGGECVCTCSAQKCLRRRGIKQRSWKMSGYFRAGTGACISQVPT